MKNGLFLGNSFTFFHDLPGMLQTLAEGAGAAWRFDSVTRGGAFLSAFSDPADPLSASALTKLEEREWDAVILQDQSLHPARDPDGLVSAAKSIAAHIRCPIFFYQTWAYEDHSEKLARTGLSYDEMADALADGYARAAEAVGGTVVPVGYGFRILRERHPEVALYSATDHFHPSLAGSYFSACCFAGLVCECEVRSLPSAEGVPEADAEKIRDAAASAILSVGK